MTAWSNSPSPERKALHDIASHDTYSRWRAADLVIDSYANAD